MSLTLGVLGGMGPAATLDFLAKLQAYTPAKTERDHIRTLVDINPQVPDMSVPGSGAGPVLAEMAGALRGAGADVLAIACNSAHAWADLIQRASGLPLVDMIGAAASTARASGARRVGVLGSRAALRLYREYLAAQAMGQVTLPADRQELFLKTIDRIRAGERGGEVRQILQALVQDLVAGGAEVIITGCTEIPLALDQEDVRVDLIDPAEALARRCVAVCLGAEPVPAMPTA